MLNKSHWRVYIPYVWLISCVLIGSYKLLPAWQGNLAKQTAYKRLVTANI